MSRPLPSELLEVVFFKSMPYTSGRAYSRHLTKLSLVSKRVASIVDGCPLLWSQIYHTYPSTILQTFLTKSGVHPLDIRWDFEREIKDRENIMVAIAHHKYRWRSLTLINPEEWGREAVERLLGGLAPILQALEITSDHGGRTFTVSGADMPRLQRVQLVGSQIRPRQPLRSLQSLSISGRRGSKLDTELLFEVLEECGLLRHLSLRNIPCSPVETEEPEGPVKDITALNLPHLETIILELIPYNLLIDLLSRVTASSCRTFLVFHKTDIDTTQSQLEDLAFKMRPFITPIIVDSSTARLTVDARGGFMSIEGDKLARYACISIQRCPTISPPVILQYMVEGLHPILSPLSTIVKCSATYNSDAEAAFFSCLRGFPNVTEVSVTTHGWARPMMSRLSQTSATLWPRLVGLHLYQGPLTVQELLFMIRSRSRSEGDDKPAPFQNLQVACLGTGAAGRNCERQIRDITGGCKLQINWDHD